VPIHRIKVRINLVVNKYDEFKNVRSNNLPAKHELQNSKNAESSWERRCTQGMRAV
jgi:hypothetical protein